MALASLPVVGSAYATVTVWPLVTAVAKVSVTVLVVALTARLLTATTLPPTLTVNAEGRGKLVSDKLLASV